MGKYLREISLTFNPGAWTLFNKRRSDKRFDTFVSRLKIEQNSQCQFCGFKDDSFLEVINLDGNYKNNTVSNMALACPICAQCFFIEMIGKTHNSGGILIHLPSITQVELNALCHAIFCGIRNGSTHSSGAKELYNSLKLRGKLVENAYGSGMSNPAFMGTMLIDTPIENKDVLSQRILKDIRVLPIIEKFHSCLDQWSSNALNPKQG